MPLSNADRAKIFLGYEDGNEPIEIIGIPSLYEDFEAALSETHKLVQGEAISFPEDLVCPGQLALYRAAQTISSRDIVLPARLQNTANMLGLAANDSTGNHLQDLIPVCHFYSGGNYLPESRETIETSVSGSPDDMLDSLLTLLNAGNAEQEQSLQSLIWDFSDRILNSRHSYNGTEHSGWWYNGGFLVEKDDHYELFCASTNIGDTFGKAWDKDPHTDETRNPLLDDAIRGEAELFFGGKCSDDLGAKIGYMMAPTNNVSRLFHSIVGFSEAFNATTQTTLVSGTGQLSMNVAPGSYNAFDIDADIFSEANHEHLLYRLSPPIFSANDFSSYKLGGTLIGIKAIWGKN